MNPIQHGGQVYQFAQTQNSSTEQALKTVLDFSASINPIQPQIHCPKLTRAAHKHSTHIIENTQWNAPLLTSLSENSMVVLVNPNTPEGIFTPPSNP